LLCSLGPDGARGPAGFAGDTGIKGDKGLVGARGPAGVDGEDGLKGNPGVDGVPGARGPKGIAAFETPDDGEAGPSGQFGGAGDVGSPGFKGDVGPTGDCIVTPEIRQWEEDMEAWMREWDAFNNRGGVSPARNIETAGSTAVANLDNLSTRFSAVQATIAADLSDRQADLDARLDAQSSYYQTIFEDMSLVLDSQLSTLQSQL
jgi:hypothetical protein